MAKGGNELVAVPSSNQKLIEFVLCREFQRFFIIRWKKPSSMILKALKVSEEMKNPEGSSSPGSSLDDTLEGFARCWCPLAFSRLTGGGNCQNNFSFLTDCMLVLLFILNFIKWCQQKLSFYSQFTVLACVLWLVFDREVFTRWSLLQCLECCDDWLDVFCFFTVLWSWLVAGAGWLLAKDLVFKVKTNDVFVRRQRCFKTTTVD